MAGRIPQSFIDDLMNRIDIVAVIDARVPLKKAGREFTACCPFHNEKTPSFTVSPNKQFYHCFGCSAHGTAVGFLMDYEHMSFPEAIEDLAHQAGMEVPYEAGERATPAQRAQQISLYEVMTQADRFYRQQLRDHPQANKAVEYLKGRGLSGEIAAEFGIGYAPPGYENLLQQLGNSPEAQQQLITTGMLIKRDSGGSYDRFRDRIMFPILDRRGRTIGFGGRVLTNDDTPKYLNSPETPLFHKGRELYGLYEARQALREIPRLLVVEGYMDVVALAQFDIRYAVATLGTATTQKHLDQLFRITPEVVFCFDGDRAGRDAAWRALENTLPVMREGRQIRFMFLPDGEDPDSQVRAIGKAGFEAGIAQATALSDYLFQQLQAEVDTHSIDGRARLVALAQPLFSKLPQGIYRQMMTAQLARLARLEPSEIAASFNSAGKPGQRKTVGNKTRPRMPSQGTARLSPVRTLLTLLIHQPSLAQGVDPNRFVDLELPGLVLLREILELLQANPHMTSSALLERWRDTEHGQHLHKLAKWQPPEDEQASLQSEFDGAIVILEQRQQEQHLDTLRAKSEQGPLTPNELEEFRRLTLKEY